MSKYRLKNADLYRVGHCMKCAKKLDPEKTVWLELDQRIDAFHDFGGVPNEYSQGAFEFGPDCAKLMRKEARQLLDKEGL
jgi:hypothetical protein